MRMAADRRWIDELARAGLQVSRDEPLARRTTFKIGGPADALVSARTKDEAVRALRIARGAGVPVLFLGFGSNMLVKDRGFRGLVLVQTGEFERVEFPGPGLVRAGAAVRVPKLAVECAERGLSGLEYLVGVPGCVGGAVVMNAGTREGEIGPLLEEVEVLDASGARVLKRGELEFSYRHSSVEGTLVSAALFLLRHGDKADIMALVAKQQQKRLQTQPIHTYNVGSTFKNPPGRFAAKMIEELGLKGHVSGGARVSPTHANFIENFAGAKASDVLALVDLIRERARAAFGVDLELEMKVVGE